MQRSRTGELAREREEKRRYGKEIIEEICFPNDEKGILGILERKVCERVKGLDFA